MELLFESRTNLSGFTGLLNFVQHQPKVHPEPVLVQDTDSDIHGVSLYGSVLNENGRLRMWYQAMPQGWNRLDDMASVAYAESDDGIHWTKPALDVVMLENSKSSLCDMGLHCPSVFIDPEALPSHRYRAVGCCYPGLFMAHPDITEIGYYTSHSADGLHWELDSTTPQWNFVPASDTISSIYHPAQRRAIIAVKSMRQVQRLMRRCIHIAEMRDGVYSEAVSALYPDEFDDVFALANGHASIDYYGMGMQATGAGTVGFIWRFLHDLPYNENPIGRVGFYGSSDVSLVYQPEAGGKWFHMPGRPSFIDHREHPWTAGWMNTASGVVEVGDEHRLYFSGQSIEHGFRHNNNWRGMPEWVEHADRHAVSGIGFASWPKYRLFGFETSRDGGFDIDLGQFDEAVELHLNYKVRSGGSVRVSVHDSEDCGLDKAVALEGDSIAEKAAWQHGTIITPKPGQKLIVRLHLVTSTVYAYEVRPMIR